MGVAVRRLGMDPADPLRQVGRAMDSRAGTFSSEPAHGELSAPRPRLRLSVMRQGTCMFAATVVSGGLGYLANAAVGRLLPPSEYSEYASMLSLTLILAALMVVIETVTTNHTAQLRAIGRVDDIGGLLFYLMRRLLFGLNSVGQQTLRLAIGVGLVLAGWGAVGAVASLPLSHCGVVVLGLLWLANGLRARNRWLY